MLPLFSQIMVSPTQQPSSLVICEGDSTFSLLIANTSGNTISGSVLNLNLPSSCLYIPGSIIGANEFDISNLNQPVFSVPDILNNTSHNMDFNAEVICGFDNSEDFIYLLTHNNNVYTGFDTPLQNYYYPSIVITNITNSSATVQVNQSITRDFTIEQQGLVASLDTLIIIDEHSSDIEVVSVSIGTLITDPGPGPILFDTIIITGSDMPGGNNSFDYGESLYISETVRLLGCDNGQSTINATWGCYEDYCENYYAYPSVSPASGVPNIDIVYTGNVQGWGFIDNSGFIEFDVTNNGSGAGTAFDLITLGGFSSSSNIYYPNNNWLNEIDSFSVNGNFIQADYNYAPGAINGRYAYYFDYSFPFDPDGPGVGIEDSDGDGVFDDLPVGHTVTVKAHTYYNWQEAQTSISTGPSCGRGWTNNAWQSFRSGYDLTDQCSSSPGATWVPNPNLLLFMTYNTNTLEHTIPADIYDGTTVWMEQQVSTSTKVDDDGCPNDSVIYNVELPDGIIIAGGTATYKGISMGIPTYNGNIATYLLNKNRVKTGGWFKVPLQIDCNVQHNPTGTIETNLKFWCDNTLYPSRFFTYWCSETPTFGIQCPVGSCTDPYITQFDVQRMTMGWVDNQLTQKADPSTPGVSLDHAMALDSIRISSTALLNGSYDSLFFYLHHNNLPGNWSNHLFFNYLTDTLQFYDSETNTWVICSDLAPSIRNGTKSGLTLNISELTSTGGCLDGYTISDGDSIKYIVIGQVRNVDRTGWETVPEFRAHFYNREFGEEKYCNDRGITYNILGSNLTFSRNTYINPATIEGCDDLLFYGQIYRWLDICNGENTFPNEVRPYVVLDSITFLLPEGFDYQPGTAIHKYRKIDGGLDSEPIADPIIEYNNNQVSLLFVRDASWSYSAYIDCSRDQDRVDFYATASCQTSSIIQSEMEVTGRYQFYADKVGITQQSTASTNKPYTPSAIELTPLITTAEGRYDTAFWDVRLCNVTSIDSDNNWLGFESISEGIDIIEIVDITISTNPIDIPVLEYGPGKKWAQLGGISGNNCRIYQVKATYSSCSTDSILTRHASNCVGYPINPELGYTPTAYACDENSTFLYLEPNDVNLNLVLTSPSNPVLLCDTLSYEAEVSNTLLSYAYNNSLTVTIPPGVTIVPSESEFSYPYTSGNYTVISDPTNHPLGSNNWVYYISQDPNAVSVLKGIDSIPNNGYKLRFKVITDCDFISGTSIKITASASNSCGAIKLRTSNSPSIIIDGLPTNTNLYVLSTDSEPYLPTCGSQSTIKTKIINLGPNSASSIELISASIDDAYDYVVGSLNPIHNGPSGLSNNTVIGGIRYLQFTIQPNLAVNDSIVFTYDLIDIDPGSLTCDTIPLTTNAMLLTSVPCSTVPSGSCNIQSITSSLTTNLQVIKDDVIFGNYIARSIPFGVSSELVTIQYSIINSGSHTFSSDSLGIIFVHDENENGIADETGADSLYYQHIEVTNLPIGESIISTAIFEVPANKVCNMLAAVRIKEDTCICSETTISIPDIELKNAGADTMVCTQRTLQVGSDSITGQSYIWVPSTYLSSSSIYNPNFYYTGTLSQPDTLIYTLITSRPGGCINRDTLQIIVYPHASVSAGSNENVCESIPFDFATSLAQPTVSNYDSLRWSGGLGIFNDPTILLPIYYPALNEVGPVKLTLTAYSMLNCSVDTSSMILTFDTLPDPVILFAPNDSICVNEPISFSGTINNSTAITSWYWNFGDGNVSNNQNVIHEFAQSGMYNVSLIATNNYGCLDSVSTTIIVNELPIASFTVLPSDTACADQEISFEGNSTTDIINWNWDFGDNTIGSGQNTEHSYITSGNYVIQLQVENENTCMDTVTDSIYIRELPSAIISTMPQDTSCLFDTVYFSGISNNNISNWIWDFGDGTTSVGQNVSHNYTNNGDYTITLVYTDNNGCSDTVESIIFIRLPSVADFIVSPYDTSCVNESNNFSGISQDDIVQWYWEFGDGNTAYGQDVSHEYSLAGTYKINLIFTDIVGCVDTITHHKIVDNPNINFNINPSPVCLGDSVYLISTGDNITYAPYNWDFDDGIGTASGYQTSYLYNQADTYDVSLSVCSKTIVQTHTVNPVCVVDAGGNQATCQDVYFNYSNSQTPPTAYGYSSILWSTTGIGYFDDPTLVTPTYFPHSTEGATQNDTINMTMIGYGIDPCSNDTSYMELIIIPGAYAQAGSDENSCIDHPYDFANSTDSSFATHYSTLYWLTTGSGYFIDPNVHQPIYVPAPGELGPITMTMVASNIINCDSIDEMILTIHPEYEVPVNITVCYYDSIFAEGEWHFSSGTYYDTLQSAFGCDSVIVTNLIVRPKIDKDFTISTGDSICYGEDVVFSPTGSANIISWFWDFGDGNTSTIANPIHHYYDLGDYTIIYYYIDENGCSDSAIQQITVFELPDVSFTINLPNACVDFPVNFSGASNSNIVSWDWDFGDGQTGTGQYISHTYSYWGDMTISLTVTDDIGCTETTTQNLIVLQPSFADFTFDLLGCDSVQFTDRSLSPTGYNIVMWNWDFGDGDTSNLQNPTHSFPNNNIPGGVVYDVSLTITTDSVGYLCYNYVSYSVLVPSNPDIFFNWNPEPTCMGDNTFFFGNSGFPISQWHWNFGDGNFSTLQNPVHVFADTGSYLVELTIIDTLGCTNSLNNEVHVAPIPQVSFTMSDSLLCSGGTILFTGTASSNVNSWYWEFGDGSFSWDQNPIHNYASPGTYTITLTVTDIEGCSNFTENHIYIIPNPSASFNYTNLSCNTVTFSDLSAAPPGYNIVQWAWDFDDGTTSTVQNPVHDFTNGIGVYNVELVVTSDSGGYFCTDTISQTVITPGLPSVFFAWDPEPTTLGNTTNFFGNSGNMITSWYWDFDDGNYSYLQNPTNIFASSGIYNVQLIVTDIDGCQNTVYHEVTVADPPELDFTWDISCEAEPVQFLILSPPTNIIDVVNWDWDFGDGGISNDMEPVHIYGMAGVYNVSLTITNNNSASNTVVKQVTVYPPPTSLFSIDPPTCESSEVQFHNLSTSSNGTITHWLWDFGDGHIQSITYPDDPDITHTYANAGNFNVTLTVTNSNGCESISQSILTINTKPTASFTHEASCVNNPVIFTDGSTENGGGSIIHYYWNFGDPGSGFDNTSNLQNPAHIYSTSGDYEVTLIIENTEGCGDTTITTITILDEPTIDFTFTEACFGTETEFESETDSDVSNYSWSFGDGGTSDLQNPTYTYTSSGDFTATLVITTIENCVVSVDHTVRVNPLPNPNFSNTSPSCLNNEVEFTDLSISQNGSIETWEWDLGDGTIISITAPDNPNISHLYNLDNTYNVTLTVIDIDGCENEITKQVEVISSPIADYSYEEFCFNDPVLFSDLSSVNGGSDIQNWQWFFGDPGSGTNNTSNLQNPEHIFSEPGTFSTTLIVTSLTGCTDTTDQEIVVDSLPVVNISILNDSICLGETANFTGSGTNISTWYWEFGDGGTSIEQNPSYVYANPGNYTVVLSVTVTGSEGCSNTVSQQIYVFGRPTSNFEYNNSCVGDSTHFIDMSVSQYAQIDSWDWDFGDGGTSILENPSHFYSDNTNYQVTLVSTDNVGCSDTMNKSVQVFDVPVPNYSYFQQCEPDGMVSFFDESIPGDEGSPIIGWNWDFSDGNFSTEIDPNYRFESTDTCYNVILTVTDDNGCTASDSANEVCLRKPTIIDFTSTKVCFGNSTLLSVSSEPGIDSISIYNWKFNDGSSADSTLMDTISHVFLHPGPSMVELIVMDTFGCTISKLKEVIVDSLPTARFENTSVSCGDPVIFTDKSEGNGADIINWSWEFGDVTSGVENTSIQQYPSHTYGLVDSTYTVNLITINQNGCVDSIEKEVFVEPCLVPTFHYKGGCLGSTDTIFDTSYMYSNHAKIEHWYWNFGDGSILEYDEQIDTLTHSYNALGTYTITLTISTTIDGVLYSKSTQSTHTAVQPSYADFTFENTCIGDTVKFNQAINTHGVPIVSWRWDFGDYSFDSDSLALNPVYYYPEVGTYEVMFKILNENGCCSKKFKDVTINSLPVAGMNFEDNCQSYYTYFYDESVSDSSHISSYAWDFGDNHSLVDFSTVKNPVYIYDSVGQYNAKLKIIDGNSCEDSTVSIVEIFPKPTSEFIIVDTIPQGQLYLQNQSQGATNYFWDFNYDYGENSNEINPMYQYKEDGTYNIMLVSYNDYGCPDTTFKTHEILFTNLFVPNAFVPSSENEQLQTFKPVGVNLVRYKIQIYSAWGNLVFESTKLKNGSPAIGWNGRHGGEDLPSGSYMWKVSALFKNGTQWKGTDNGDGNTTTSGTLVLIR